MKINLLPDSQKQALKQEKIKLKVWVALAYFGLCLVLFFCVLFSLNYMAKTKAKNFVGQTIEKNNPQNQEKFKTTKIQIEGLNTELVFSSQVLIDKVYFSDFLEKMVGITTSQVYFERIFLKKGSREVPKSKESEEKETQFFAQGELEGIAKTRENLYDFRTTLLNQGAWLETVYFLPISWKLPIESEFSLGLLYFLPKK
ncbi:hypothetical protein L6252_01620 [Candidatus Parcubacteria bacterium]|nr:hypothetical protein [Candidatus Parcubacteria bacterium]